MTFSGRVVSEISALEIPHAYHGIRVAPNIIPNGSTMATTEIASTLKIAA